MYALNATDVRKDFSRVTESAIRVRPVFIKKTRDFMVLSSAELFERVLEPYTYTACSFVEDDGSITLSLNEIDLVENGSSEEEAKAKLAAAIMEYAEEYYKEFDILSLAPNRKHHVPFVLKAILIGDAKKISESIQCQSGAN